MALFDSFIVFAVGLLIGAIGIYLGGRIVAGEGDYTYAIGTAFIGSSIWSLVTFLTGGLGIGPLLALLAWIWVINRRYSSGWLNAVLIALIAWLTTALVLSLLVSLGIVSFVAIGVPV